VEDYNYFTCDICGKNWTAQQAYKQFGKAGEAILRVKGDPVKSEHKCYDMDGHETDCETHKIIGIGWSKDENWKSAEASIGEAREESEFDESDLRSLKSLLRQKHQEGDYGNKKKWVADIKWLQKEIARIESRAEEYDIIGHQTMTFSPDPNRKGMNKPFPDMRHSECEYCNFQLSFPTKEFGSKRAEIDRKMARHMIQKHSDKLMNTFSHTRQFLDKLERTAGMKINR